MITRVWVTVVPGTDRPYCSTTPPSVDRKKLINEKNGKIFRADIKLPGFDITEDGVIEAVAIEDNASEEVDIT